MIIDIVDENDQVIGKKEKELVHKEGDWHRVAHVWVCNSNWEVLCHKRADCKKMFPGLWDVIIGGHTNRGELYEEAAIREAAEEIGINIDSSQLVEIGKWKGVANPSEPNNREVIKIFAAKYDGGIESLNVEKKEISELKFIPLAELKEISKNEAGRKKFISFDYLDDIADKLEKFIGEDSALRSFCKVQ